MISRYTHCIAGLNDSMRRFALIIITAMLSLAPIQASAFTRVIAQFKEAATATKGATSVLVYYSDACAENVAFSVSFMGSRTYAEASEEVSRLLQDATKTVRAECPQIKWIDVGITGNNPAMRWLKGELTEANGWRLNPVPGNTIPPGYIGFRAGHPDYPGHIRVSEFGEVTGQFPLGYGWSPKFEGKVTPKMVGDYISQYQIEGYLYDYAGPTNTVRGAKKQCDSPRNGYAYWSSFQWIAGSGNTLWQGAGGTHWPCAEANSAGQTFQSVFYIDDSNPFSIVNVAKTKPQAPSGPIVVAQGAGWRLTTDDRLWCTNNGGQFSLTYDAPHEERLKALTGGDGGTYRGFVEQTLLPQLRKQCPTISSVAMLTYRSGESDAYDHLSYSVSKLGSGSVQRSPQAGLTRAQFLSACAGCHAAGAGGAPIAGRQDGWSNPPHKRERVGADMVYHFNKMHCPDCAINELKSVILNIDSPKMSKPAQLNARQQKLAQYAKNPGPEQLIKSGLLSRSGLIADIYHGRVSRTTDRTELYSLFRDYITLFHRRCEKLLPPDRARYVFPFTRLDSIETTPLGTTRHWVTEEGRVVEMEPRFLPVFSKKPGGIADYEAEIDNPLNPRPQINRQFDPSGLIAAMTRRVMPDPDKILNRTSDMSALLANEQYCAHPASKQFIDNLFKALQ